MENIEGLSLDEAIVSPYLTEVDKWISITNSTFPSSPWEVFVVGDLLLGPRGWDPVRVWEGYRLGEWIPLLEMPPDNSSEWRTINFESVWFLPIAGKKSHREHSRTSQGRQLTPVLRDSAVRENPAGKAEPARSCSRGRWPGGLTGTEGGGPRLSATCRIEGQRQLDVKWGTIFPPHAPSLLDLFTRQWSLKAEGSVAWGQWRA